MGIAHDIVCKDLQSFRLSDNSVMPLVFKDGFALWEVERVVIGACEGGDEFIDDFRERDARRAIGYFDD